MRSSFSSSQIQTYLQCPWKYYLIYKAKIAWPKPVNQLFRDFEAETILGEEFHRAVHRNLQGIQTAALSIDENSKLKGWIENFLNLDPTAGAMQVFSEYELNAVVDDTLWSGKFDCIAQFERSIVIFDWKTSRKPFQRKMLLKAAQTRLYPFLLASNLDRFAGDQAYDINSIWMVYWNPNFPEAKVSLSYDAAQFQADRVYLKLMAEQLNQQVSDAFPKTENLKNCQYCNFQTRCLRGMFDEPIDEMSIDWENMPSIDDNEQGAEDTEFFIK